MFSQFRHFLTFSRQFHFLNKWRVSLAFGFFYIIVNILIYFLNGLSYPNTNAASFLTSWFNPTEDWTYTPGPLRGIELNYALPQVSLVIIEYYSRNMQRERTKKYISIDSVFVMGIFSTYILSGLVWYASGKKNSGSSIVAYTLFVAYAYIIWWDIYDWIFERLSVGNFIRSTWLEFKKMSSHSFLRFILVLFVAPTLVSFVILDVEPNHIVGLGIFALFSLLLIGSRWNQAATIS